MIRAKSYSQQAKSQDTFQDSFMFINAVAATSTSEVVMSIEMTAEDDGLAYREVCDSGSSSTTTMVATSS